MYLYYAVLAVYYRCYVMLTIITAIIMSTVLAVNNHSQFEHYFPQLYKYDRGFK